MKEPTVPLIRRPTIHDFLLILDGQKPCACTRELKETGGKPEERPEGVEQVLCEGCGAREVLNSVATLADTIRERANPFSE
jgi:hypothetical protein